MAFSVKLPKFLSNRIPSNWANYWINFYKDYRDVGLDIIQQTKNRPIRTSIQGITLAGIYILAQKNPDEESYLLNIRNYSNEMVLVHKSCHNPHAAEYIRFLQKCFNEGIIRRISLGIMSFIWLDNYNDDVCLYKARSKYTNSSILSIPFRIIDIGLYNTWWNLEEKMIDFDVNI